MPEYLVTWQIDIDADSPEEAAARARRYQRQSGSETNHFTVEDKESGKAVEVALNSPSNTDMREPRCSTCGGTEVLLDALAEWDWANQEWVLRSTHHNPYCETCEDGCSYEMVKTNQDS